MPTLFEVFPHFLVGGCEGEEGHKWEKGGTGKQILEIYGIVNGDTYEQKNWGGSCDWGLVGHVGRPLHPTF